MNFSKIKCYFLIATTLILVSQQLQGQLDTANYTPFTKGISLVALNGSISSSVNNRPIIDRGSEQVMNNYSFEVRLAKVVARNYALGLSFSTERFSSQRIIITDIEIMAIGPWSSYYFTNGQSGGLFIQAAFFYINYYERNQMLEVTPPIDDFVTGKGFAGSLGFGYTYVMFNRVGLEVSMNYRQARIYGDFTNKITRTNTQEVFNKVDITFNFGFIVLFNPIKND